MQIAVIVYLVVANNTIKQQFNNMSVKILSDQGKVIKKLSDGNWVGSKVFTLIQVASTD